MTARNAQEPPRRWGAEQVPGFVIAAAMLAGLAAVNSPFKSIYDYAHHATVHIGIGLFMSDQPLIFWINEGLIVFFFLLVGMEIKRELLEGHLSMLRQAALPALAAVGGMAAPALIYLGLTWKFPAWAHGWAIPTATDIVLALAVLSLLGSRIPRSLKVFLTALAIFDDIGAVLIVAVFYGEKVALAPLMIAGLALAGLWLANRFHTGRIWPYVIAGGTLWLAMLGTGLEGGLAGVLIAFAVPLRGKEDNPSPLRRAERGLEPWVVFVVIPVFAFFNSGIVVTSRILDDFVNPVSLGIVLGLFLGKPLGILSAAWISIRLGVAQLPHDATWPQMWGVSAAAGIGFTMSLFIAILAFSDPRMVAVAKLAVLTGSLLSGAAGVLILYTATGTAPPHDQKAED